MARHFTAGQCELPGYPDGEGVGAAVFCSTDGQPFCFVDLDIVVGGSLDLAIAQAQIIADALNFSQSEANGIAEVIASAEGLIEAMANDVDKPPVCNAWDRLRRALLHYRVNRIAAKDLAFASSIEKRRMHHRTGVPARHSMSAASLASWALGIAEAHQPNEQMPEAIVDLPDGIWFDFESSAPVAGVLRP